MHTKSCTLSSKQTSKSLLLKVFKWYHQSWINKANERAHLTQNIKTFAFSIKVREVRQVCNTITLCSVCSHTEPSLTPTITMAKPIISNQHERKSLNDLINTTKQFLWRIPLLICWVEKGFSHKAAVLLNHNSGLKIHSTSVVYGRTCKLYNHPQWNPQNQHALFCKCVRLFRTISSTSTLNIGVSMAVLVSQLAFLAHTTN